MCLYRIKGDGSIGWQEQSSYSGWFGALAPDQIAISLDELVVILWQGKASGFCSISKGAEGG